MSRPKAPCRVRASETMILLLGNIVCIFVCFYVFSLVLVLVVTLVAVSVGGGMSLEGVVELL